MHDLYFVTICLAFDTEISEAKPGEVGKDIGCLSVHGSVQMLLIYVLGVNIGSVGIQLLRVSDFYFTLVALARGNDRLTRRINSAVVYLVAIT